MMELEKETKDIESRVEETGRNKTGKIRFWLNFSAWILSVSLIFLLWIFVFTPLVKNNLMVINKGKTVYFDGKTYKQGKKEIIEDIDRLKKKLDRLTPGGAYLIVNTSDNVFYLYKDQKLLVQGMCSTGSNVRLELDEKNKWEFETPKGVFSIKGKTTSPVWKKPDWAFVEEGLPVPSANDPSRYEYGVLGDYALSLGAGYLIHGTLYKRFLGLPVTHGCIRMNDEDLETVYQTLPIGAKVFIY